MELRITATLIAGMLLCACGSESGPGHATADGQPRPNVLLISIDTLRPDHLGCYGYERDTSPHIDALAAQGARFATHLSSSSWTLPAHAALFTSVADSVHGVVDPRSTALAPEFTTLAERFSDAGYATLGLFAGPYLHPSFGLAQGFDEYIDCTGYSEAMPEDKASWIFELDVMLGSHRDVTGERVYQAARSWIEGKREEDGEAAPFFAFLHFWDVHFDFIPPAPYDTLFDPDYEGPIDGRDFFYDNRRYRRDMPARDFEHLLALYDGEVRWTDEVVGRLLADLDEWGLADNTIVALTSDHGTEFFEHNGKTHRTTLFDELIRIPLIVRYPGKVRAGAVIEAQTRIIDVGPTLLELAGLPTDLGPFSEGGAVGQSLLPLLSGDPMPQLGAALSELVADRVRLRSLRTRQGKIIERLGGGGLVWFDLEEDPGEKRPLRELGSGRGAELARAYLEAVEELETAVSESPGAARRPDLGAALEAQLQAFGYVGYDEDREGGGDDE